MTPVAGRCVDGQCSKTRLTSRPRRCRPYPSRGRVVCGASSTKSDVCFSNPGDNAEQVATQTVLHPGGHRVVVHDAGRRVILAGTALTLASALGQMCGCGGCALAMADLIQADATKSAAFDVSRDATRDALFAEGMSSGMTGYEMAIADRKNKLFSQMLERLPGFDETNPSAEATIVEVGMGTFPNANLYFGAGRTYDCLLPAAALGSSTLCDVKQDSTQYSKFPKLDIVGVDPNDAMEKYARANFAEAGNKNQNQNQVILRIAHGVAEALPLPSDSADAVVCTLTLCSVFDPKAAVAEIRRVLKPGGSFLFIEHVLATDDASLRAQQIALDGLQAKLADGCHLNRDTLATIENAGFLKLETVERFTLPGFGLISSQIAGIAINA